MPSSLIWIALIAGWILVLFPMVSGSRTPVARTGAATEETRVLHRGGKARPVRRGPALGHLSDPEWQPSPEEEHARRFVPTVNDPKTAPVEVEMDSDTTDSEESLAAVPTEALDAVVVGEEIDAAADTSAPEGDAESAEGDAESADEVVADLAEDSADDSAEGIAEDLAEDPAAPDPVETVGNAADEVTAVEVGEAVDEVSSEGRLRDGVPVHRPGRGGFDPEADNVARAIRYRNRQRTMLGLAGLTVVSILASFLFSTLFVWGAVTFGLLLGAYLYYLRRQVRIEHQIRQRRMARLQRSRRAAVAVRRAAHTVPGEARRYGAVVLECDDEDPAFEHLPHYETVYGRQETRAAG